jgi:hypothetical protein
VIPLKLLAIINSDGHVVFDEPELFRRWLDRYTETAIEVIVQARKRDKTQPQLGYLFGHVVPQIAGYTGYSEEEVYGILKYKFLKSRACLNSNADSVHAEEYVRSLADCTREEVSKFIEQCVQWGTQLGAEIFPANHYGGSTQ